MKRAVAVNGDTTVLVGLREAYDESHAGETMSSEGEVMEGRYPNARYVLTKEGKRWAKINWSSVEKLVAEMSKRVSELAKDKVLNVEGKKISVDDAAIVIDFMTNSGRRVRAAYRVAELKQLLSYRDLINPKDDCFVSEDNGFLFVEGLGGEAIVVPREKLGEHDKPMEEGRWNTADFYKQGETEYLDLSDRMIIEYDAEWDMTLPDNKRVGGDKGPKVKKKPSGKTPFHKVDGNSGEDSSATSSQPQPVSAARRALRRVIEKALGRKGVLGDWQEGQEIIDKFERLLQMSRNKKSAPEIAVPGEDSPFKATIISETDRTKVQQNIETIVKNSENLTLRDRKNFLDKLAEALGAEQDGSNSKYVTLVTKNGTTVTIRLANHNATVSKFDNRERENGISLVISRKPNKGITNDGEAHIVEFFYPDKALKKADGSPYADIAKSIQQVLYSGEYKDTTGLALRQEVNLPKLFRTSSGEAYGFAYKGKIYIDPEIAGADTPIHEYAHLWAEAIRQRDPKMWDDIVRQMKKLTDVWERVRENYPGLETDSEIAEEVLAHYSGERGEKRLLDDLGEVDESDPMLKTRVIDTVERVRHTLNGIWRRVADFFGWTVKNPDRIADRILRDLLDENEELVGKDRHSEEPIFVSNARKAVEDIRQDKATAEQWLAMIQKKGGFKAAEDKWLGLSEWLNDRKGKPVTKQELLDFIRQNQVHVEEVHYSDNALAPLQREFDEILAQNGNDSEAAMEEMRERHGDDFSLAVSEDGGELSLNDGYEDYPEYVGGGSRAINSTRMGYTTSGLDNKREIALTVPGIEPWEGSDELHFGDAGGGRAVAWVRFGETKDEDGNRVLVIDEIQSKRHQEGREKGYSGTKKDKKALADYEKSMTEKYGDNWIKECSDAEMDEYDKLEVQAFSGKQSSGIPDAPFSKNWHELAMKRMLRYAAENGYDRVAWTKGEQQAERYNLSHVIKGDVEVYTDPHPASDEMAAWKTVTIPVENETYKLSVNKAGVIVSDRIIGGQSVYKMPLKNLIGAELADKVMGTENGLEIISVSDMKVGGEGMKGFYDKMLPSFMDKYGKKWGVRTHDIHLPLLEEAGQTMHAVDVTPEMRESVMQGQPMFSFAGSRKDFDATRERAIEERGIVMPGLADKEVAVVNVDKMEDGKLHPFDLSLPETQKKRSIENYAVEHGLTGDVEVEGGVVNVSKSAIGQFVDAGHVKKSVSNGVGADVYVAAILKLKEIIKNTVDAEIYPDFIEKTEDGKRKRTSISPTSLLHIMYGAVNIDNKDYRVKLFVIEQKGSNKNNPHFYELKEIELSDGHHEVVESEPTRKSDRTISVAILLNKVGRAKYPDEILLEKSAELDKTDSNSENQDKTSASDVLFRADEGTPLATEHQKKSREEMASGKVPFNGKVRQEGEASKFVELGKRAFKNFRGTVIDRFKGNVGKEMAGKVYVHKDYATDIIPKDIYDAAAKIAEKEGFAYNSVCYDKKQPHIVRFDEAPDFDTAREPITGKWIKVDTRTGEVVAEGQSNQIWHHKWAWVKDDYKGFDVDEAYEWSKEWSQRIANPDGWAYKWDYLLEQAGLPVDWSGSRLAAEEQGELSQGFSSAGTSRNQTPAGMQMPKYERGTVNVDIGGGRFEKATNWLREQGVENLVFDPFNRDAEHNREVAERVRAEKVDTASCHNVLNVIDNERARANVILQAAKAIKPDGTAYFSVYVGDESGVGRQTRDGWQNNRKPKDYVKEIERYFDEVTVKTQGKKNLITARKPKATAEKSVWDFDGTYSGNSLAYRTQSSPETGRYEIESYRGDNGLSEANKQTMYRVKGVDSGLFGEYNAVDKLVDAMREKFPDRKVTLSEDGKHVEVSDSPKVRQGKGYDAYVQKKTERARRVVAEHGEKYGLDIELVEDERGLTEKQKKAKGWYDPVTGKIKINLGRHHSEADIKRTILHEGVAHHGLRKMMTLNV